MTGSAALLLGLLFVAMVAFASDRAPADIVALVTLLALVFLGYVSPSEAFAGFSSGAVIILIAAFVFTGALARSGVAEKIGHWLIAVSAGRKGLLRGAVLATAAGLSLVMNNVAASAVLLPGVTDALRRRHISPSKLLLPLALATQLGGMATLLTTSNIIAGEVLKQKGLQPFGLMDFVPVGGTLALIGLVYLYFVSDRLTPERSDTAEHLHAVAPRRSLENIYEMRRRLVSARILPSSPLVGGALGASGITQLLGGVVIAVVHSDGTQRRAPEPTMTLVEGDVLILDGLPRERDVLEAAGLELVRIKRPTRYLASKRVALLEGVVPPRSRYAGQTLKGMSFRENHGGISVLSILRNGEFIEGSIGEIRLRFGDVLLMQGPRSAYHGLRSEGDLVLIGEETLPESPAVEKIPVAITVLVATLAAAIIFSHQTPLVLFTGAAVMVLTRTLTTEEAYRAIDWRSVVLVGGMLPMSLALTRSGAAAAVSHMLVGEAHNPIVLLGVFVLLTVILTQILPGGAATPLVMVPIAISAAIHAGVSPRAFAMAVALATSTSMLTPFSHPVNIMVMGPGGYRFRDYGRIGFPLVILMAVGIVGMVWLTML